MMYLCIAPKPNRQFTQKMNRVEKIQFNLVIPMCKTAPAQGNVLDTTEEIREDTDKSTQRLKVPWAPHAVDNALKTRHIKIRMGSQLNMPHQLD